jgi:putative Holliday junction resolvase
VPHSNNPEEFLGVDVGSARVGIARGSSAARIAQPIETVSADEATSRLKLLAAENQTTAIVVGLPRSLMGDDTAQTEYIRKWVSRAKTEISLPFYWQDEALTTRQAEELGVKNHTVDARAAAIILQDFLDTPEEDRVRA